MAHFLAITRLEECAGVSIKAGKDNLLQDEALERRLLSMNTPNLRALHEASTLDEARRSQAVVVIVSSMPRGSSREEEPEVVVRLSALNSIVGELIFGSHSSRHHFLQSAKGQDRGQGAVLLVFQPVVTLASESVQALNRQQQMGKKGGGMTDRIQLYISDQKQVLYVGQAKDISKCGAQTRSGGLCSLIVNTTNCRHCHFHAQGGSSGNAVQSVAFTEVALQKNRAGLAALQGQGTGTAMPPSSSSSSSSSRPGGGGVNPLLSNRAVALTGREQTLLNMTRGNTHKTEHLQTSISASALQQRQQQQASKAQHPDTHSARGAVVAPFNGPFSTNQHRSGGTAAAYHGTALVMPQSAESTAIQNSGGQLYKVGVVAVPASSSSSSVSNNKRPAAAAAAAGAGASSGRGSSDPDPLKRSRPNTAPTSLSSGSSGRINSGVASAAAVGESMGMGGGDEETPEEQALLGMGATRRDGAVSVPQQSRAFDKCNRQFRGENAPAASSSSSSGSLPGGLIRGSGNSILNGSAATPADGGRAFTSLSAISRSTSNRRMSQEQINQRKLGAQAYKEQQKQAVLARKSNDNRLFNTGITMAGSVIVDTSKLFKNAESFKPKPSAAAAAKVNMQAKLRQSAQDREIEELLNRKSTHADEAEDEQHEELKKRMSMLEKKEFVANKENSVTFVKVTAFYCMTCNQTTEDAPSVCRSKGHVVQMTKACKRYFECKVCSTRTHTMGDILPKRTCTKCGQVSWRPCGSKGSALTGTVFGGINAHRGSLEKGLVVSGSDYTTRNDTDSLASRARGLDRS